jgi:hypothetical protein
MAQQAIYPRQSAASNRYYEEIVSHPLTERYMLLRDHDAVKFILAIDKIEVPNAPFTSGMELLEYVLDPENFSAPQIAFPHKTVVIFFTAHDQRPMLVVSTAATRLKAAIKELLPEISVSVAITIGNLITSRGERTADEQG